MKLTHGYLITFKIDNKSRTHVCSNREALDELILEKTGRTPDTFMNTIRYLSSTNLSIFGAKIPMTFKLPRGINNIELDLESGSLTGTLTICFPSMGFRYQQFRKLFANPKPFNVGILLGLEEFATIQGIVYAIFLNQAMLTIWKIHRGQEHVKED